MAKVPGVYRVKKIVGLVVLCGVFGSTFDVQIGLELVEKGGLKEWSCHC
jgi:hypothetical protein